jgi:hypothetical protein
LREAADKGNQYQIYDFCPIANEILLEILLNQTSSLHTEFSAHAMVELQHMLISGQVYIAKLININSSPLVLGY